MFSLLTDSYHLHLLLRLFALLLLCAGLTLCVMALMRPTAMFTRPLALALGGGTFAVSLDNAAMIELALKTGLFHLPQARLAFIIAIALFTVALLLIKQSVSR